MVKLIIFKSLEMLFVSIYNYAVTMFKLTRYQSSIIFTIYYSMRIRFHVNYYQPTNI